MENKVKILYIIRGLPSSGKTTLARTFNCEHFESDMYFLNDKGDYVFEPLHIGKAHVWCQQSVREAMIDASKTKGEHKYDRIMVTDILSTESEIKPYIDMANDHGYYVFSLIVENRRNGILNPEITRAYLDSLSKKFSIKLF